MSRATEGGRVGAILAEDLWRRIQQWADSGPFAEQRLATVMEYLDGVLDPKLVKEAREAQPVEA